MTIDHRRLLRDLLQAAIDAAAPALCVPANLPDRPKGRTVLVGAGKAAAAMAAAVEAHWDGPLEGLVVTRYGHGVACRQIEVVEASHPDPDRAGDRAARRILALVSKLSKDDLVLVLLSGGGSALLTSPIAGVEFDELVDLNARLLRSGAAIGEINCVRRHLNALAGGRLAAACHPAKVVSLLISDVPGDNPADIASGPTVADSTTCADALAVLERFEISVAPALRAMLASGRGESIKPGDPRLAGAETRIIAAPRKSLQAAAEVARAANVTPRLLSDRLEGEARHVGTALAGIARHIADHAEPMVPPCVLLSGGETTVTVHGEGRGGRNSEFLLAFGIAVEGHPCISAIAGDTDGIDGIEEIAGAMWLPDSQLRARRLGIDPKSSLARNDAHSFFEALGDGVVTGPTLTNVNDFRAILIV
ncbi:glycerate kinase type-2 family protein [Bradyrhizobium sp.]|jgi:hydroxypyruvate reductase|uniref:glycerate kinase type-2 family protein n=1 Tax=Bradyrhizobium sp. TaxID=376 RepID=UPI003C600577